MQFLTEFKFESFFGRTNNVSLNYLSFSFKCINQLNKMYTITRKFVALTRAVKNKKDQKTWISKDLYCDCVYFRMRLLSVLQNI